jgi:cell division GTPase FtsZ
MKSFTGALFAAQATAIKLQEAEFNPIFDPISPEHYMNANDLATFEDFAKN